MKNLFLTLLILSTLYLIPAPSHAALSDGTRRLLDLTGRTTRWTSATAGTTNDVSGNGYGGTMSNLRRNTTPTVGKVGQGLYYDGTQTSIVSISGTLDIPTLPFTMTTWIKPTSRTDYR